MEEKGLFEDFEMRTWQITPRIYKILGFATAVNFLILFAFGQFSIFTTRGCDTPYVGMVCQVLDSAYVASVFMGDDTKWESRDYEKTELEDADITYLDVSDQLTYPDGYFALANPEDQTPKTDLNSEFAALNPTGGNDPLATTPSLKSGLLDKPPVMPPPAKNNENEEAPPLFTIEGENPKSKNNPKVIPTKQPKTPNLNRGKTPLSDDSPGKLPPGSQVAQNNAKPIKSPPPSPTPTPSADDAAAGFATTFNKKPLQDLADEVIAKIDSTKPEEKVDLKQPFKIVLQGKLTKDGKFDTKGTRYIGKAEGNEQMINVAKEALEALGDSSILHYLQQLGVDNVNITFAQDDKQISAVVLSSQPTEENARTVSSGFNTMIAGAKLLVKEPEVQALMSAMKFKPQGKNFVLNFAMPKDQAHQIIDQKLGEARQKKSQPDSNDVNKTTATKG